MSEVCLTWDDEDEVWSETLFTWSDCKLIEEIVDEGGGGGWHHIPQWVTSSLDKLESEKDKDKKKRLIKLVTYVKENKILNEHEVKDLKIEVSDIVLVKNSMEKRLSVKIGG